MPARHEVTHGLRLSSRAHANISTRYLECLALSSRRPVAWGRPSPAGGAFEGKALPLTSGASTRLSHNHALCVMPWFRRQVMFVVVASDESRLALVTRLKRKLSDW
jgi:hypothetical protein